ncbi:MAG: hypothetical protein O3C40_33720 [Planctomycetota bacterium]|nr:hypothetical protein [Planctomycetota bacterium]
MNDSWASLRITGLLIVAAITARPPLMEAADLPRPVVKVVESGESKLKLEEVSR